MFIAKESDLIY